MAEGPKYNVIFRTTERSLVCQAPVWPSAQCLVRSGWIRAR